MQKNIIICGLDGVLNSFVPPIGTLDLDCAAPHPFDDPDPAFRLVQTTYRLIKHLVNNMHVNLGDPEVWIVTGRTLAVRAPTAEWLMQSLVPCTTVIMRSMGDTRPEAELKRALLRDGTIPRERVFCAFDAGIEVAQMWRAEGITCYQSA
jgi:hypothetical protein